MTMKKLLMVLWLLPVASSWTLPAGPKKSAVQLAAISTSSTFSSTSPTLDQLKCQILQLGAAMDRGQSYNPTSGEYYKGTMDTARSKITDLLEQYPNKVPATLEDIQGEWELVISTVKHGIFRSSPFFLAVQEAFSFAEEQGKYEDLLDHSYAAVLQLLQLHPQNRGLWGGQGNLVFQITRIANVFVGCFQDWSCGATY